MVTPFLNPKETAKGVKNLVIGTAQKLIPGEQEFEKYPDAIWEQLVKEYGSYDAIKETIATRPAKVLLDVSSLLSGAGTAVRATGALGKAEKVGKLGKMAQRAGATIEPISAIKTGIAQIGKRVKPDLPRSMFESAAKFSKVLPKKERMARAQTALEHGISPSYKGVDKALEKVWALKRTVDDKVANLTMEGKRIPATDILKGTDPLRRQFSHGMAKTNIRAIDKVIDDVMFGVDDLQRSGTLSPREINKIKRSLYDEINFINKKKSSVAKEATQKNIAQSAKKTLEKLDPSIGPANKEMGELLGLLESLPQSAARIADRDIMGIGMPIKIAAGQQMGPMGKFLGPAAAIADIPQLKAGMAQALHGAQYPGSVAPALRQGMFQTGQAMDILRQKELLGQ